MDRRLFAGLMAATAMALPLSEGARGQDGGTAWRSVGERVQGTSFADAPSQDGPAGTAQNDRSSAASAGPATLPNEHGQIWREYDIGPYTMRVTNTNRPEQAVVDWILRETGYEAWHGEPLAILSATKRTLRVYHTPEMHERVAGLVDRFVRTEGQTWHFSLRVVTVDSPGWRARAQGMLRPVAVQTPGVQCWLLAREDAAMLLADLRRRSDFREHSTPHLTVNNGQSTVVASTRAQSYVRNVQLKPNAWPGFESDMGQVDEGFSLEFSPLLSADGQIIDATVKCHVDQVEKMVPVMLDVPTPVAPRQRAKIEVPQMAHYRFHERFRWPADQVLLLGLGVVALPIPADNRGPVPGLPLPIPTGPPRADLLVFLEGRPSAAGGGAPQTLVRDPAAYAPRY